MVIESTSETMFTVFGKYTKVYTKSPKYTKNFFSDNITSKRSGRLSR